MRKIDVATIRFALDGGAIVLLSPLGYSPTGEAFNLSMEDVAASTAVALDADKLIVLAETAIEGADGVLHGEISEADAGQLLDSGTLAEDSAFTLRHALHACEGGVARAHVIPYGIDGSVLLELFQHDGVGTMLVEETLESVREATPDDVGGLLALLHAVAAVTCRADQTISGIALNLIGPGFALFFCRMFFEGATMSKPIANKLPKIFGNLTTQNAVAKNLNLDVTAVLAVALTVLMWFVLYRTKWGLRIRSVGEHPAAADSLGISVTRVRYLCVLLSGVFAGFGGSCMTLDIITQYTPTAISGQGFIALAAVIFGKWTPQGAYGACLLFGFAQALTVVLGGGKFAVPSEILAMLPYVLTILVLILFVGRAVAPKEDGIPYEKGAR